jgi:hypothetical protein
LWFGWRRKSIASQSMAKHLAEAADELVGEAKNRVARRDGRRATL